MKLKLNTSKRNKIDDLLAQIILGIKVILKITANVATFPHLKNTIADIKTANTELNTPCSGLKTKNNDFKVAFDGKHIIWLNIFGNLASYIGIISKGNEAIIYKSGFPST